MTMKKSIIMAFLPLCLLSCATGRTAQEKKADAAQLQSQIEDSLGNRTFSVTVNYVTPLRMPQRQLTTDYSLTIKGDTLDSWLPYFGVAHRADLSQERKSPLSFKAPITGWRVVKGKKDSYNVSFETKNNMEILDYFLTVFSNGNVSVSINSSDRDPITFDGDMDVTLGNK